MHYILFHIILILSIIQICHSRSALRIIGGKDANEDKYPFIASLEHQVAFFVGIPIVQYVHVCTCAVLTPSWTLTAAHCLELTGPTFFAKYSLKPVIRYGTLEKNSISEVINIARHPGYRIRFYDLTNDIGLIETEVITLRQYARVSALDFVTLIGQEVTLVGNGITNSSGVVDDAISLGKPLQILEAIVVQCDKKDVVMTPAVCVARRCGQSAGICPGDSGGPMLHSSGVVGVNSLGPNDLQKFCALKSKTPFYDVATITPISPFINWISDTITKRALLPSAKSL